jgi:hypothetical protein
LDREVFPFDFEAEWVGFSHLFFFPFWLLPLILFGILVLHVSGLGTGFSKVPILVADFTFEGNLFVVYLLDVGPTIQVSLYCLWETLLYIHFYT